MTAQSVQSTFDASRVACADRAMALVTTLVAPAHEDSGCDADASAADARPPATTKGADPVGPLPVLPV